MNIGRAIDRRETLQMLQPLSVDSNSCQDEWQLKLIKLMKEGEGQSVSQSHCR